jgi:hypothetical protein
MYYDYKTTCMGRNGLKYTKTIAKNLRYQSSNEKLKEQSAYFIMSGLS